MSMGCISAMPTFVTSLSDEITSIPEFKRKLKDGNLDLTVINLYLEVKSMVVSVID